MKDCGDMMCMICRNAWAGSPGTCAGIAVSVHVLLFLHIVVVVVIVLVALKRFDAIKFYASPLQFCLHSSTSSQIVENFFNTTTTDKLENYVINSTKVQDNGAT